MLIGRSDRKNRFVSHLLVLRLLGLVPWHSCSFGSTNPKQARFVYTFNIGLMHNSSHPRICIIPPPHTCIFLSVLGLVLGVLLMLGVRVSAKRRSTTRQSFFPSVSLGVPHYIFKIWGLDFAVAARSIGPSSRLTGHHRET